jgi:hypothetical protein
VAGAGLDRRRARWHRPLVIHRSPATFTITLHDHELGEAGASRSRARRSRRSRSLLTIPSPAQPALHDPEPGAAGAHDHPSRSRARRSRRTRSPLTIPSPAQPAHTITSSAKPAHTIPSPAKPAITITITNSIRTVRTELARDRLEPATAVCASGLAEQLDVSAELRLGRALGALQQQPPFVVDPGADPFAAIDAQPRTQ